MIGHVLDLDPNQRRELLGLLTQERTDLQTDEQVLAEISETLRRQLSLSAATDLAEGFRRRMIRIADELGDGHTPGHYDFLTDRAIAEDVLTLVGEQAGVLSTDADDAFKVDFAKAFRTMSQDKRAAWLRDAALARSAAESGEPDAQEAADAAKQKSSADDTAAHIAADVWRVEDLYRAARKAGAPKAHRGCRPPRARGRRGGRLRDPREAKISSSRKPPTCKSVAIGKLPKPWSRPAPTYSPRCKRPNRRVALPLRTTSGQRALALPGEAMGQDAAGR